ncbi:hypothetical protein E6C27_scaffold102G00930 [Cucumis melo var. makuwa]|uniref:DNA-directed RNA polymerase I subunit RPA1-like n=1 Tax=Cucumis melo var. makuwa TaxID=1194695 RepID=A0A5A7UFL1_CUCMM|nr:hypothetical protein E6C27_scaffold102G00930 [Cucumis melo var. makuwa]
MVVAPREKVLENVVKEKKGIATSIPPISLTSKKKVVKEKEVIDTRSSITNNECLLEKQQTFTFPDELSSQLDKTPTSSPHSLRHSHLSLPSSTPGHGEFSVDSLSVDSIEGHNQVSGKGFPTTGPRIEAGNVIIHRGLHVTRPLVVACVLSGVRSCLRIDPDAGCSCALRICASFGSTRLICASFGSTRLICASFGSTRLICASFGSTRLMCASFGSTRLICAFYGTTRLLCRVRAQREVDRRGAERMREGHMDASDFLIAFADVFCQNIWFCDFELMI